MFIILRNCFGVLREMKRRRPNSWIFQLLLLPGVGLQMYIQGGIITNGRLPYILEF